MFKIIDHRSLYTNQNSKNRIAIKFLNGFSVPNVPKDHIESGEDFESWRHQPPNHGPSYVPITTTTDPYNTAYYNSSGAAAAQFQYPPFGVGDGTWSSGNENLTILSGYGQESYSVDGKCFKKKIIEFF